MAVAAATATRREITSESRRPAPWVSRPATRATTATAAATRPSRKWSGWVLTGGPAVKRPPATWATTSPTAITPSTNRSGMRNRGGAGRSVTSVRLRLPRAGAPAAGEKGDDRPRGHHDECRPVGHRDAGVAAKRLQPVCRRGEERLARGAERARRHEQ